MTWAGGNRGEFGRPVDAQEVMSFSAGEWGDGTVKPSPLQRHGVLFMGVCFAEKPSTASVE